MISYLKFSLWQNNCSIYFVNVQKDAPFPSKNRNASCNMNATNWVPMQLLINNCLVFFQLNFVISGVHCILIKSSPPKLNNFDRVLFLYIFLPISLDSLSTPHIGSVDNQFSAERIVRPSGNVNKSFPYDSTDKRRNGRNTVYLNIFQMPYLDTLFSCLSIK